MPAVKNNMLTDAKYFGKVTSDLENIMISYGDKMPDHISDGPQTPCDAPKDYVVEESDLSYDEWAQFLLDEKRRRAEEIIGESIKETLNDIFGTNQAD